MKRIYATVAVLPALLAGVANAETASSVVNTTWGDADSGLVVQDTITITQAVASINSITVILAHSWDRDLDITVNGFENFDLMFNEGAGFYMGDGLGIGLENTLAYEFVPIGTPGAMTDFGIVDPNPAGTYEANAWNTSMFAPNTQFTLEVVDLFTFDGGSVASWSIDFTPLPAPGALALLGLAGLVGTRRRRSEHAR